MILYDAWGRFVPPEMVERCYKENILDPISKIDYLRIKQDEEDRKYFSRIFEELRKKEEKYIPNLINSEYTFPFKESKEKTKNIIIDLPEIIKLK